MICRFHCGAVWLTCCEGRPGYGGGGGDSDDEADTEDLLDAFDPVAEEDALEEDEEEEEAEEAPEDSLESYFLTGFGGEGNSSQFTQLSLPWTAEELFSADFSWLLTAAGCCWLAAAVWDFLAYKL